jgi:hypothetical protein
MRTVPNARHKIMTANCGGCQRYSATAIITVLRAAGSSNIQTFLFLGLTDRLFGWRLVVSSGEEKLQTE